MVAGSIRQRTYTVKLKTPHSQQLRFIRSSASRRIIRSGRRGGKTTGLAILAVEEFLKGKRVLFAVPVQEQIQRFWGEVTLALADLIDAGIFKKNETWHTIELPGTEQRIRAKTAYNADTLRGDYAECIILDEWQLCNEDAWHVVAAPMMLDRPKSIAVFAYTPPSLRSAGVTKAHDPMHAAKMFAAAQADTTGRWQAFHFTSHENPYLDRQALADITKDMSHLAYRQEIEAEDLTAIPGALWSRTLFHYKELT